MWDIFFISYQESNAEQNWITLKSFHPNAKRLHGIKGIDRAHIACNQLSTTDFFWVVDGDNKLLRELSYQTYPDIDLLMFNALDPMDLKPTSLGAVKLWRKNSFINHDMSKGDFTLFSVKNKKVLDEHFSITAYNFTAYEAWKTAFRHCVKLMSIILGSRDPRYATNIQNYINRWSKTKDSSASNSEWSYKGYLDAKEYVDKHDNDMSMLNLINNYDWLIDYFNTKYNA